MDTLPLDDFMDLCHYLLLSNFDTIVFMASPELHAARVRELRYALLDIEGDRVEGAPSWWHGELEAAESGLAIARMLGLSVNAEFN